MYLAKGSKYWEMTPPQEQVLLFDPIMKEFYNYKVIARCHGLRREFGVCSLALGSTPTV